MKSSRNWNTEELFFKGDAFFSRLIEDLGEARSSIDFEIYIFDHDPLGDRVADALIQAAKRSVRVRVLVDGAGSPGWSRDYLPRLVAAGVHAKVFRPMPWDRAARRLRTPWFLRIHKLYGRMSRRNHRKVCVVDRKIAYVGGINVSRDQVEEFSGPKAWRDTAVRITGPQVAALPLAFDAAWGKRRAAPAEFPAVNLNFTRSARLKNYKELILRMIDAKHRIWLTNAYFVPGIALLRALQFTAWAKVDVRLLVPSYTRPFFMKWAARAYFYLLLRSGVRVYEYLPAFLHAKTALIDDWATVGSSNLNHRSLIHDLEVDVELSQWRSIKTLERQFLHDLENAREIRLRSWGIRSWWERVLERIMMKFRYWI